MALLHNLIVCMAAVGIVYTIMSTTTTTAVAAVKSADPATSKAAATVKSTDTAASKAAATVTTTGYGGGGFIEAVCSGGPIPSGSAFWGNLGATLHQLVENTAYSDFYFKTQNGGYNCPAYGEASCDKSVLLSAEDCTDCLFHLSYRIWSICGDTLSAQVKYGGCSLHYDNKRI